MWILCEKQAMPTHTEIVPRYVKNDFQKIAIQHI